MKRLIFLSIFFFLPAGAGDLGSKVFAQAQTSASFAVSEYPFWLEVEWDRFNNALSVGNYTAALETIQSARKKGSGSGITRFDSFSAALIRKGEAALLEKDFQKGITLGELALGWSPGYPQASFFLAKSHFKNSPLNIFPPVKYWIKGISAGLRDFWHTYYLLGHALLIISAGAVGSFLFFVFHVFFRSLPLITHSFFEWGVLSKFGYWGIIGFLILLPFATGWGLGISLFIALVLSWSFSSRSEKTFLGLFVLMGGTAVFWLPFAFSLYIAGLSGEIHIMAHSIVGQAGSPRVIPPPASSTATGENFNFVLSKAMVNGRLEKFDLALSDYEAAQKFRPDYSLIDNNIGNIYLKTKRFDQAISSYKNAAAKFPKKMTPYFNLNLVYSDLFRFDEATKALEKAQELNLSRTQTLSETTEGPVDELLDKRLLWKKVFSGWEFKTEQARTLFNILFNPVDLSKSYFLAVGFIVGIGIFGLVFNQRYISQPCGLCRKPICFQCQRRLFDLKVCKTCWTLSRNIKRKGDLREIRVQRKKTRRKAEISSLILPGSGHLLYKKAFRGFVFITFFLAFIFLVFFHSWLLQPPGGSGGISGFWLVPISLTGLIILYVLVFMDMRRFQAEEGV